MSDPAHKETDRLLAEAEKRIAKEYKRANEEVGAKLQAYLQKFEDDDKKMRERLQKGEITAKDYANFRARKIAVGKRWEALRDTLAEDYHNANQIAMSTIRGHLPEVYAINHNFATYQVEHDALVDTNYTLYDRHTVERLMEQDRDLLPAARPGSKTARMLAENKDLRWNRSHIQSEMLQGILQGESIGQISKRLQRVTDMNESAARRNARTLTTGAENAGRVNAYHRAEDMGIEMMQEWQATLDSRTRHTHALMHGERVPVGEEFSNGCKYPGDPSGEPAEIYNCRCTLIAQIKGFETDRVETSPKLEGQSFDDWLKEHEAAAGETQEERRAANEARNTAKQDFTKSSENGIMNKERMSRARKIKDIDDLNKVSSSKVIGMESNDEIKHYFESTYGIKIEDFENCKLFSLKATMAGFDDALAEFPDANSRIKRIYFDPKFRDYGEIDKKGNVRIGKKGLKDYGTGVHETLHALDYKKSKPGTNSFSEDIVRRARVELGLRKNSTVYKNLAYLLTRDVADAADPAEVFAYAIESEKGGVGNELSAVIYKLTKESAK